MAIRPSVSCVSAINSGGGGRILFTYSRCAQTVPQVMQAVKKSVSDSNRQFRRLSISIINILRPVFFFITRDFLYPTVTVNMAPPFKEELRQSAILSHKEGH